MTVFERVDQAGGAFRLAGKAPLFQEVEADGRALTTYIDELVRACLQKNMTFRFGVDVSRNPGLLTPFDRIVIATGARYRFGLGPLVKFLLNTGLARRPPLRNLFARPALRDWFYFQARCGSDDDIRRLARPDQVVMTIGDARKAGKSKEAIASAFAAALLPVL